MRSTVRSTAEVADEVAMAGAVKAGSVATGSVQDTRMEESDGSSHS